MTYKWLISRFEKRLQGNENVVNLGNREPLDYPAMSGMSQAELADLPLPAYSKENCTGSIRVI